MKSRTKAWIVTLIVLLICRAAFPQRAQLSRLGTQATRPVSQGPASPAKGEAPLYTFTFGVVDYPRSQIGAAYGINDSGRIVGGYNNTNVMEFLADHGFELKGNNFSTINYPGAVFTDVLGMCHVSGNGTV